MDHPHGGRVLRLRHVEGEPPTVKGLSGATFRATGPRGESRTFKVLGFPVMGGKVSDSRIRETGRIDVHVAEEEGEGAPVSLTWMVTPA
ncbi:MAG: hypothetical protein EA350_06925 [Gemmatimonadales bacterium]|nr:MAG: hypothetical protein EA350_06925 [Gemmatimonadales bacterium]